MGGIDTIENDLLYYDTNIQQQQKAAFEVRKVLTQFKSQADVENCLENAAIYFFIRIQPTENFKLMLNTNHI